MTDESSKHGCEGCYDRYTNRCTFSDRSLRFPYERYERVNECPCSTCLVKAICVKSCKEYDIFWKVEHEIRTSKLIEDRKMK